MTAVAPLVVLSVVRVQLGRGQARTGELAGAFALTESGCVTRGTWGMQSTGEVSVAP